MLDRQHLNCGQPSDDEIIALSLRRVYTGRVYTEFQVVILGVINSSSPGQNGRPIDNSSELVKIMAWRRIGDKPLSEPMVTRFTGAYMQH